MLRAAGVGVRHPERSAAPAFRRTRRSAASRRGSAGSRRFTPAVRSIDAAAQPTQGCAGSRRRRPEEAFARRPSTFDHAEALRAPGAGATPEGCPPGRSRPRSAAGNAPRRAAGSHSPAAAGLPVTNASTSKLFQPNTRSAGVRPGSPQSVDLGPVAPPSTRVGERCSHRRRRLRGRHSGTRMRAARVGDRGDGVGEHDAGIGEQAAPVARMVAAVAQLEREVEIEHAARAEEEGRPAGLRGAGRRMRSARRP